MDILIVRHLAAFEDNTVDWTPGSSDINIDERVNDLYTTTKTHIGAIWWVLITAKSLLFCSYGDPHLLLNQVKTSCIIA